jgi:hypothetical protein
MKTKITALICIVLALGINSLFAQKSEDRELSPFSEITLRMGAQVNLKQGNTQSVTVKGDQATLDKLVTEVKDRKLVIRFKTESVFSSSFKPGPVEIDLTVPEIDKLSVLGSGSIVSKDLIESRILDLAVSGSGSIEFSDLKTDKVSSVLSGSGNISLAGKQTASEFKALISGSGNIKASDFNANNANIKIVGSGNCWITANKNLVARIAGSGNIIYHGNPAVDQSTTGSGKVKSE